MGKRGPIPKTNQQRKLEGNPSKRPLKGDSPKPGPTRPTCPTCPTWLPPEAKAEWRRVAPELFRLGLLTQLDRTALAMYCVSFAWWRRCQEIIAKEGGVYVTARGKVDTRPEVEIARIEQEIVQKMAVEFGLTPVSRARLRLPGPVSEEEDEMEQLLNGTWRPQE